MHRDEVQGSDYSMTSKRVAKAIAFAVGMSASIALAQSDVSDAHQKTTTPADARFEIIQSQLTAKWTFRLDRYTGEISQLVRTDDDEKAWELMAVEGSPLIPNPNKPRFMIFTSGLAARHTFLMNFESGQTWVLTTTEVPASEGRTFTINMWKSFQY